MKPLLWHGEQQLNMHRMLVAGSSPLGWPRPVPSSRQCVACYVGRYESNPGAGRLSSDTQYVSSCSSSLEELHRAHHVSCPAISRHNRKLANRTTAAAHADSPQTSPSRAESSDTENMLAQPAMQLPVALSSATAEELLPVSLQHINSNINSQPGNLQHQRHRSTHTLQRPAALSHKAMRQLLQQQIEAATCWQQLHQLLVGRSQSLTLKHLSLMVFRVAQLQVEANKQRLQQLRSQHHRNQHHQTCANASGNAGYSSSMYNSSSGSAAGIWQYSNTIRRSNSRLAAPPQDVLSAEAHASDHSSSSVEGLEPFLQQLAAAVQTAVVSDPGLTTMVKSSAENIAESAAAAALQTDTPSNGVASFIPAADVQAADNSGSSKPSSSGGFSNPPERLATYLANVVWGYAKLCHSPAEDQLLLWLEAFAAVCCTADAVSFSQVCWSLGQLQFWPGDEVMEQLAAELARRMEASCASAANVSESAEDIGIPQLQQQQQDLGSVAAADATEGSCSGGVSVQQYLSCRALTNILWSFAVLGYTPTSRVLQTIWPGSIQSLSTASPQTLSNMIWAIASLGLKPTADWMIEWQLAVMKGLQDQQWGSADLANAAWAIGKFASSQDLRSLVPDLPWRLSLMRASRGVLTTADPRELVALTWGFTAAGVAFTETFTDRLLTAVAAKRVHFKAREWAQLLVVLAKQGLTPHPVWQRGCHAAISTRLRFMSAMDVATCLWGIARLGVEPRRAWKERFFAESYGQLFFLTPSNCCALIWALGRLQWRPPLEWQDRLFLETYIKVANFTAAELTGTLHGLAALQLQPPVQWMCQAAAAVSLAVPDLGPQEITTCLWALSRLRYRPPEPWLAALAAQAAQLLPAAWTVDRQQFPQQPGSSSSSSVEEAAAGNSEAGHPGPSAEAAHLLRVQEQQDRQEAAVRYRRLQLMQRLKQADHKQQQQEALRLQQGFGAYKLKPRLDKSKISKQQLQLRGDLELLQQQGVAARVSAASKQRRLPIEDAGVGVQQASTIAAAAAAAGVPGVTASDSADITVSDGAQQDLQQQQQQQQAVRPSPGTRLLGYHDVRIVLEAFEQLHYKPDSDHPLLLAARLLGLVDSSGGLLRRKVSNSNSSTRSVASSPSAGVATAEQAVAGQSLCIADGLAQDSAVMSQRDATAAEEDEDDDDVFTPNVGVAASAEQIMADSCGSSEVGWPGHGGQQLHVIPEQALGRRKRHGRRFAITQLN